MRSNALVKATLFIYFTILVLFLFHVLFSTDMQDFLRSAKDSEQRDYTGDWILESGETVDLDDISAGRYGGSYVISKTLPDKMQENDAICFSTSNLNFDVFVNGDSIYSYSTRENVTGTGDGISYHMIGLGTKDQGGIVRIEARSAFKDRHGGRINDMQFGPEELYRYSKVRHGLVAFVLSALMIIFGIVVIAFFVGLARKNPIMRSLWALGLASIIFGLWSLCDTGIPQLVTGSTYATREIIYGILHIAGFPLIYFVYYITKKKRRLYIYLSLLTTFLGFGGLLFSRYILGFDMHNLVGIIYFSYSTQLVWLVVMLVDNEIYCRKAGKASFLNYFYVGAAIFITACFADMGRYLVNKKCSMERGNIFRFGLVIFFFFMAFQIFDWWAKEKTSLERDRFVNQLLQYIMDSTDPDNKIHKVLQYLCEGLKADRAYIFEDMKDGTLNNTYEYCAVGVESQIDNLKGLPYEGVIDAWYEEYKKGGHVLINDLEKYREVSEPMYEVLKPQGIKTLVTGPLILDGEYIGFFGVDNPPAHAMEEISEIMRLLMFFLSELVSRRDSHNRLVEYSYHDSLTGVGNRRAIREFEKDKLDTAKPYGFIMCDINGLKAINDSEGHEAGDEIIKKVSSCLKEVFGPDNVYRMGGDEFAIYSFAESEEMFKGMIDIARKMIEKKGAHVALGYSYAKDGDTNYNARRIEADNRMYNEKREYYQSNHIDRRRS